MIGLERIARRDYGIHKVLAMDHNDIIKVGSIHLRIVELNCIIGGPVLRSRNNHSKSYFCIDNHV